MMSHEQWPAHKPINRKNEQRFYRAAVVRDEPELDLPWSPSSPAVGVVLFLVGLLLGALGMYFVIVDGVCK